ncbi:hypothetical protein [Galbitalea soli]|uniref:Uncharacterized protein n=1 Tax=Galbitalea soli TaxID=1268042 RepID=A0A7C9TRZ2_9MICO|nr:hypothetical protein [Galbitalea soli]NEM92398.1 hypothetical protein [Galbitalea soli]NYJ31643.1 hypothetical protein [Galbitalea soli]
MATNARAARWSAVADGTWVFVVAFTAAFHFYRGAPIDGVLFGGVALLLALDALGAFRRARFGTWHPPIRAITLVAAGAAAVLALTPRHGVADAVALGAAGILVGAAAWPDNPAKPMGRPWGRRLVATATAWSAVFLAIAIWELAMYFLGSFASGGRERFPALSDLLDPLLETTVGRILFVAAWLLGGVALIGREWRVRR